MSCDTKYFFLSCPRYCDWGLIVVIVYYFQIWNKKNTSFLIEFLAVTWVPCILRHPLSLSLSLTLYIYIYIYTHEVHTISFQTFFIWALLLIVHTWNSSPLPSNLLRLQCTCTIPTTSGRPHGSPLVWACQWPLSQSLSSPQLSHKDSLRA